MTEILFYHLEHRPLERVLPELLEKCLERGWRAVVQTAEQERLEALDTQLWTYRDIAFLPHGTAADGAPERQPDHAARACRAALKIADAVAAQAGEASGHPPIRLKIALHTGRLLVGNIGAKSRMNYTVIGDTVNTCSRIEGLARDFDDGKGSVILVSGDAAGQASEDASLSFEDVGAFTVKGRQEQVRVCRLTQD